MQKGNRVKRKLKWVPHGRDAQVGDGLVYKVNVSKFDVLLLLHGAEGFAVSRSDQIPIDGFDIVPNQPGDAEIMRAYEALCARPRERQA